MVIEEAGQLVEPLAAVCIQLCRVSSEHSIIEREQQAAIDDFGLQPEDLPLQVLRIASCVDIHDAHFLQLSLLLVGCGLSHRALVHRLFFMRARRCGCTH